MYLSVEFVFCFCLNGVSEMLFTKLLIELQTLLGLLYLLPHYTKFYVNLQLVAN